MPKPRILAFAGSLRSGSYNKKLIRVVAGGAQKAGAEVTVIDLADYPLPILDEDLEKRDGLPANGRKLKDLFVSHHGLIIASPEYNSSVSAALKNVIDWVSRPSTGADGKPESPFGGKIGALVAASPGALGGLRGLVHARMILSNLGVLVIPNQIAVMKANEAFAEDGTLKDAKQQAAAEAVGAKTVEIASRLIP